MFTKMFQVNSNLEGLEIAIDQVLEKIKTTNPTTEEYTELTDRLKKLYDCKATETPARISPETLVNVGASLIGIAAVLNYERTHVVTTKTFALATRFFR